VYEKSNPLSSVAFVYIMHRIIFITNACIPYYSCYIIIIIIIITLINEFTLISVCTYIINTYIYVYILNILYRYNMYDFYFIFVCAGRSGTWSQRELGSWSFVAVPLGLPPLRGGVWIPFQRVSTPKNIPTYTHTLL